VTKTRFTPLHLENGGFFIEKSYACPMHKVSICDLTKTFLQGGVRVSVLDAVSAVFEQGVSIAITGVSGSGKSTLLHLMAGLDVPDSGSVNYDEQPLDTLSVQEREQYLATHIGLVFQQPYLIAELTVLENCMLKGLITGLPAEQCRMRAVDLLARVGLADRADHMPTALSGGQQQRVALARALFGPPAFIFADEPTGNLDRATGKSMIDLLLRTVNEQGAGLVIISHDVYVEQVVDQVWHLSSGKLNRIR
jgi:predicted ABC-type transport system involved in lysophospholipase L1 biosynthesis ATPase subunit